MKSIPKKLVKQDAREESAHTVDIRGTNKIATFPNRVVRAAQVAGAILPNSMPRRDGRATRIMNTRINLISVVRRAVHIIKNQVTPKKCEWHPRATCRGR